MARKMTVCGGGNAAHVLIALAGNAGWEVDVFAPFADEAQRLLIQPGIIAQAGDVTFTGNPRRVSADPAEVIPGSELILLALPAFAHGTILEMIAGHLDCRASIGTFPARGGYDYQAQHLLEIDRLSLTIFGLQTLPWACRIAQYGQKVEILGTKSEVALAVTPSDCVTSVRAQLAFIPGVKFVALSSFLALTLANTGQLIHPGIMFGLCRGRERETFSAQEIPLFYQSVDAATAGVLESLSCESQDIARAVAGQIPGFDPREVLPLYDWLLRAYPSDIQDSSTLERAFVTNRAYQGLRIPTRLAASGDYAADLTARYLSEDVPFGLVVARGIAELASTATPAIDEVILWAQEQLGKAYLQSGRLAGADLNQTRAPQVYGIRSLQRLAELTRQARGS